MSASVDICPYCDETIEAGDQRADTVQSFHQECLIRAVAGSAAHQLGECSCCGGTRSDPPGMSVRDSARLAYEAFQMLQGAAGPQGAPQA